MKKANQSTGKLEHSAERIAPAKSQQTFKVSALPGAGSRGMAPGGAGAHGKTGIKDYSKITTITPENVKEAKKFLTKMNHNAITQLRTKGLHTSNNLENLKILKDSGFFSK